MSEKRYNYIYKTVDLFSQMYYIGRHSTDNLNDGYLGSGTYLAKVLKQKGRHNFLHIRLEFFDTIDDVIRREKEIITEELLNDPLCMNKSLGGSGGVITKELQIYFSRKGNTKQKWLFENDPEWVRKRSKKISESLKGSQFFKGKRHTDETKKKMSQSQSLLQSGCKNSQYGTKWINNGSLNKKVKSDNLNLYLDSGWTIGRILRP